MFDPLQMCICGVVLYPNYMNHFHVLCISVLDTPQSLIPFSNTYKQCYMAHVYRTTKMMHEVWPEAAVLGVGTLSSYWVPWLE